MEKQTLPNSTLILILGIVSILGCCCYGIFGIIAAIVALVLAKKATALYLEEPELYDGFDNVKTGKILSYIGLVLNGVYIVYLIYIITMIGYEGILEAQQKLMEQYGG